MMYNTQNYWVFGHCPSSGIPVYFLEYWTVDKVQNPSNSESNRTLWRLVQSVLNHSPFLKTRVLETKLCVISHIF
jgi:hypothetical protein